MGNIGNCGKCENWDESPMSQEKTLEIVGDSWVKSPTPSNGSGGFYFKNPLDGSSGSESDLWSMFGQRLVGPAIVVMMVMLPIAERLSSLLIQSMASAPPNNSKYQVVNT